MSEEEKVTLEERVGTLSIENLFKIENLSIPPYQRPYAWEKEQVIALIDDLLSAFNAGKEQYLIGNMIFHKEENQEYIVDGQQRIITLALILKKLKIEKKFLDQEINILSSKRIIENNEIISNKFKNLNEEKKQNISKYLLKNMIVTYIKAKSQDEAFILFDSQNTRGKELDRKDLLKVHHIRYMPDNNEAKKNIAKKWEEINTSSEELDKSNEDVDNMLQILSIIRHSVRGELIGYDLCSVDVFNEFKTEIGKSMLNNYNQPPIFGDFHYDIKTDFLTLIYKNFELPNQNNSVFKIEHLPYKIINSIEGGERFFWYVLKYFQLFSKLKNNDFFKLLDGLSGNGNLYLRKIYKSSIMFYVDKFGKEHLEKFALRVYILLFYFRYKKDQVRNNGIVKFEWNESEKFDIFKMILLRDSTDILLKKLDEYIEFEIKNEDNSQKKLSGVKSDFWEASKNYREEIICIVGENKWAIS